MESPQVDLQSIFTYGIDIYDRRIYLSGEINQESATNTIKAINLFSHTIEPIELMIQSPGGDICATFAVYDVIRSLSCKEFPIHTIGVGEVCSGAMLLLACGFTRSAHSNLYCMAHPAVSDVPEGHTYSVLSGAKATNEMGSRFWSLLAKHTNLSAKEWEDEAKDAGEVWMTVNDLKKRGVIDDIISPAVIPKRKKNAPRKR